VAVGLISGGYAYLIIFNLNEQMEYQFQYSSYIWQSILLVEETGVPGENH
jgi:hypothetical protein